MQADKKHRRQKQKQKTDDKQHQKQKPSQKYKQLCKQQLKKQPPIYLLNSIKQKIISLDLDLLQLDDIVFIPLFFKLNVIKLHVFCQQKDKKSSGIGNGSPIYSTMRFKDLLKQIGKAITQLPNLKSLIFENVPLTIRHMIALKQSIANSQYIKQLCFRGCQLTDEHLQTIKTSIAKNQSLVILDLSNNKLQNSGGMIGKIMSQHSSRRDELIWFASLRGQPLVDDLSKKGICQVNLQNNSIDDHAARELVGFLKDDQWTRCINIRGNKLNQEGVKQFAKLMKKNSSLISLDLRNNAGFTKQYSLYILKKLKQNIQKYKQQKKSYLKNKQVRYQNNEQADILNQKKDQHKSLEQSRHKSSKKQQASRAVLQFNLSNNNITAMHENRKSSIRKLQALHNDIKCKKCKNLTLDVLKLSKRNLDLQIQIKKLRHVLLTRNIDVSAILPHSHTLINHSNTSQLSPQPIYRTHNLISSTINNNNSLNNIGSNTNIPTNIPSNIASINVQLNANNAQSDEQLIMKVQQILLQLTKLMDGMQHHNNTTVAYNQYNIQNNHSNSNNMSNTIPLFAHPQGLQQQQLQIEQEDVSHIVHNQQNSNNDSNNSNSIYISKNRILQKQSKEEENVLHTNNNTNTNNRNKSNSSNGKNGNENVVAINIRNRQQKQQQ